MKYLLAAAIVAVGLSGVTAGSAVADKTWTSDPAPKTTTRSTVSPFVYCNRSGSKCFRAYGYRSARWAKAARDLAAGLSPQSARNRFEPRDVKLGQRDEWQACLAFGGRRVAWAQPYRAWLWNRKPPV